MKRLVLIGLLCACGVQQPLNQWYTTQGVIHLAWTLEVWNPNKSTLKATYSNTTPGGVVDGFYWELEPNGNCKQLRFDGVARAQDNTRALVIDDADVIRLAVNGVNQCYAVIDTAPDPDDKNRKLYAAFGAKELLKNVVASRVLYSSATSITTIVQNLSSLLPPSVTYVSGNVQSGLINAQPFDYVVAPLATILDDLAALCGCTWGVNVTGEFFFRTPSATATSIAYSTTIPKHLERQSEGIVTAVTLPIATRNPIALYQKGNGELIHGAANEQNPIVYQYADAANSTYDREIIKPVDYLDPCLKNYSGTVNAGSWSNLSHATDGDLATYATNINAGVNTSNYLELIRTTALPSIIGLQIEYSTNSAPQSLTARIIVNDVAASVQRWFVEASMPKTNDHGTRNIIRVYGQYTGGLSVDEIYFGFTGFISAGDVRIYDIAALELNTTDLEKYAKSFIKLPSSYVKSLTLNNLLQVPSPRVEITGTPSGTITTDATAYKYHHSTDKSETIIEIGSRGTSEAVRIQRQTMQQLDDRDRVTTRAIADRR